MRFALWLYGLTAETEQHYVLRQLFVFHSLPVSRYPHPSLALTSALGDAFLPFLDDSVEQAAEQIATKSDAALCLFYASLLDSETGIITALEQSDKDLLNHLLIFLFFHTALSKDMLSFPTPNLTWSTTSGIGEPELMTFQSICLELLEQVIQTKISTLIVRYLPLHETIWLYNLNPSQPQKTPRDTMLEGFFAMFFLCPHF